MIQSGMNLNVAIVQSTHVFSNIYYKQTLLKIAHDIDTGKDFALLMSSYDFFPDTFSQLITSGYHSGNLEESLYNISDYMKSELESKRTVILSLIEPIIIILMGIFTLLIVMAILLPILKMNTLILK